MLEELRLNPRSPAARTWGRCPGEHAAIDRQQTDLDLSTGCTEGLRLPSTSRQHQSTRSGEGTYQEGAV